MSRLRPGARKPQPSPFLSRRHLHHRPRRERAQHGSASTRGGRGPNEESATDGYATGESWIMNHAKRAHKRGRIGAPIRRALSVCLPMASRIRALRRTWPVLDSNEPNGPDWEIKLWSRTVLAQASADVAKRLAASSALPVLGKDLLPLITGVVVVVDLAMRHWVFLRICVERRYLGHRGSPLVTHIPILVLRLGPPVKPVASAGGVGGVVPSPAPANPTRRRSLSRSIPRCS